MNQGINAKENLQSGKIVLDPKKNPLSSFMQANPDIDPEETREWLDSLEAVLHTDGAHRAQYILERLSEFLSSSAKGSSSAFSKLSQSKKFSTSLLNTPYLNTISVEEEPTYPGDIDIERKISAVVRWNSLAMVLRANKKSDGIGGHIATYASSAIIYDVAYNHFFKGPKGDFEGDAVFFQGHASPGIYARSFVEGILSKSQLENFRRELASGGGLSSYPHPRLMPNYWQFPTVSMGLGPLMAISTARHKKFLYNRGLKDTSKSNVYAFIGDGETDEVETLGGISIAAREKLDNLVFVINCNLQRLDGPVRGNGKIIQELEGIFNGAGWNVIKVVWGSNWDPILKKDKNDVLKKLFEDTVDGEYQRISTLSGAERRKEFFGKYQDVAEIVKDLTDEELENLRRGGHDEMKVYSAFHRATQQKNGKPTVILMKTVKGFGMGESGEGRNVAHQQKKMSAESLLLFKKRFNIPVDDLEKTPFYSFPDGSKEKEYINDVRSRLGAMLPVRQDKFVTPTLPSEEIYAKLREGSKGREVSTTMAFVQILSTLLRDKNISKYIVPIIPDESRTFGMEGLFKQYGIYSPNGQLYTPVDKNSLMAYTERINGQVFQEGINEAGAMTTFIANGTSYSTHGLPMMPFYIYYSMFGFQRVGDLIWAAADMKVKGFLVGGTAGRTTLNGEGLQHEDGHSQILASTVPTIAAYDPAFGYEIATIVQNGLKRMYIDNEDVFYYLTVYNENYVQPQAPENYDEIKDGIIKGAYKYSSAIPKTKKATQKVALLASGVSIKMAKEAAEILSSQFDIATDIWSVTSFKALRDEALLCERENLLNPGKKEKVPYITQALEGNADVFVGVTDYMRIYAEMIARFIPGEFFPLGTDGFGKSSTREELRNYFETSAPYIVLATLHLLQKKGAIKDSVVQKAIKAFSINPKKSSGLTENVKGNASKKTS